MQVRGPPSVGIVRFDGPVTIQFIRLPGFVQVTLIVWLEPGVGLELGEGVEVGLAVGLGAELGEGVEVGLAVGLEIELGMGVIDPGLHVKPGDSMHGVELGMGVIDPGLHVKPGDSIHGVGLATGGLLHCRLNFTEPPFSVNKPWSASGICWLRVSLVLPWVPFTS
jgi:hypothetical protein